LTRESENTYDAGNARRKSVTVLYVTKTNEKQGMLGFICGPTYVCSEYLIMLWTLKMAVQVATERNAEGNSYVLKNGE
jgi:hypothetical protein